MTSFLSKLIPTFIPVQAAALLETTFRGQQLQDLLILQSNQQECDIRYLQTACTTLLSLNSPSLAPTVTQITTTAAAISRCSEALQAKVDQCLQALTLLSTQLKQHAEENAATAEKLARQPAGAELGMEKQFLSSVQAEMGQRAAQVAMVRGHCTHLSPFNEFVERLKSDAAGQMIEQQRQLPLTSLVAPPNNAVELRKEFEILQQAHHTMASQLQQLAARIAAPIQQNDRPLGKKLRGDAAPSTTTEGGAKTGANTTTTERHQQLIQRNSSMAGEEGGKQKEDASLIEDDGKENVDASQSQGLVGSQPQSQQPSLKKDGTLSEDYKRSEELHDLPPTQTLDDDDETADKPATGEEPEPMVAKIQSSLVAMDKQRAYNKFISQNDSTSPGSRLARQHQGGESGSGVHETKATTKSPSATPDPLAFTQPGEKRPYGVESTVQQPKHHAKRLRRSRFAEEEEEKARPSQKTSSGNEDSDRQEGDEAMHNAEGNLVYPAAQTPAIEKRVDSTGQEPPIEVPFAGAAKGATPYFLHGRCYGGGTHTTTQATPMYGGVTHKEGPTPGTAASGGMQKMPRSQRSSGNGVDITE